MHKRGVAFKQIIFVVLLMGILLAISVSPIEEDSVLKEKISLDQSKGVITYEDTDNPINLNFTLQAKLVGTYVNLTDFLWYIKNKKSIKFGWNRTFDIPLALQDITIPARYIIESDKNLRIKGNNIISESRFTPSTCGSLKCKQERFEKIDFSDICTDAFGVSGNGTVELSFSPNCFFTQINSNKIQLDFIVNYDSVNRFINIDPTIQITDVSSVNSILTNITAEIGNNFTHLSFGDVNTGVINVSNVFAYYSFDTNTSTTIFDYSQNNRDAGPNGIARKNDTGFIGGGITFPGTIDNYYEIGSGSDFENICNTASGCTFAAWINQRVTQGKNIITRSDFTDDRFIEWQIDSSNSLEFRITKDGSTPVCQTAISNFPQNSWEHVTWTWNNRTNATRMYHNGLIAVEANCTFDHIQVGAGGWGDNEPTRIGAQGSLASDFRGDLDEILILNISLTASQALDLFNNQSSRFFPRGEQIFPDVNVSSDSSENRINITLNGTTNTNFDSVINISVGDQSGDDYTYGTEVNFTNNQANDITISTPNNISLKFIFYAGNRSLNTDFNSFITPNLVNDIVIDSFTDPDTLAPNVIVQVPANNTNHSTANIDLNVTSSATDVSVWWYTNDSGVNNYSFTELGNNLTGASQPIWDEGHNFLIVFINDTSANENSTTVNFTVDTVEPGMTIASPELNQNYSTNAYDLNASFTDISTSPRFWWYSNNSGHVNSSTIAIGTNLTASTQPFWLEGFHNVTVFVNDSVGNRNSTQVNFTIDTIPPGAFFDNPIFNQNFSTIRQDLNVTGFDITTLAEFWWYSNDSGFTNSSTFVMGINLTGSTNPFWLEGFHNVTIYINDSVNNLNTTQTNFTIDTLEPRIIISQPILNRNYSTNRVDINISGIDVTTAPEFWWYSNDSGFTNSSTFVVGDNLSESILPFWLEGFHNVTVFVNDSVNNLNSSQINFTIDTVLPTVFIDVPANNSNHSIATIDLNVSAIDTSTAPEFWWYTNDSGTTNSSTNVLGINLTLIWEEGHNFVIVYVNDSVGNENLTAVNFSIDTIPPVISNALINQSSNVELNRRVRVNATVTDSGFNLELVTLQVNPPGLSAFNVTPTQSGNEFFNDTIFLNIAGRWTFVFFANDTLSNRANNLTALDLLSNSFINVVTPDVPSTGGGGAEGKTASQLPTPPLEVITTGLQSILGFGRDRFTDFLIVNRNLLIFLFLLTLGSLVLFNNSVRTALGLEEKKD